MISKTDGEIPYDGVPIPEQDKVKIVVTVVFIMLASAGLVFSVVSLTFNFLFRQTK